MSGAPIRKRVIAVDFQPTAIERSNLGLCRHGSHLVGQRPSTGLPARRKHGLRPTSQSFAMGCGLTLSKHTFADDLAVSVGFRPCHWRRLRLERTRFTPAVNGLIKDSFSNVALETASKIGSKPSPSTTIHAKLNATLWLHLLLSVLYFQMSKTPLLRRFREPMMQTHHH